MANVIRSGADEVAPLPRRLVYRRLMQGLDGRHDGWLFTRPELAEEGIQADAAAVLRRALGRGWQVIGTDAGEVIVSRHDGLTQARAALERAFPGSASA